MQYDDVVKGMKQIVVDKQKASPFAPDPLSRRERSVEPKRAKTGPAPTAMKRGRSVCPRVKARDNVTPFGVEFLDEGERLKRRIQSFIEDVKTEDDVQREKIKMARNLDLHQRK